MAKGLEAPSVNFVPIAVDASLSFSPVHVVRPCLALGDLNLGNFSKNPLLE